MEKLGLQSLVVIQVDYKKTPALGWVFTLISKNHLPNSLSVFESRLSEQARSVTEVPKWEAR